MLDFLNFLDLTYENIDTRCSVIPLVSSGNRMGNPQENKHI